MSGGCLQLFQKFDAASAMLPLKSTHMCFDVRLWYFKDIVEIPSLPLGKSQPLL